MSGISPGTENVPLTVCARMAAQLTVIGVNLRDMSAKDHKIMMARIVKSLRGDYKMRLLADEVCAEPARPDGDAGRGSGG